MLSYKMRVVATIVLFGVAIAAQVAAPIAPQQSHEFASSSQATATHRVSQTNAETPAADHQGHNSGAVSPQHCTATGHCSTSAINADHLRYAVQPARAGRIPSRVDIDAAPGFAYPPYRPPAPLS